MRSEKAAMDIRLKEILLIQVVLVVRSNCSKIATDDESSCRDINQIKPHLSSNYSCPFEYIS